MLTKVTNMGERPSWMGEDAYDSLLQFGRVTNSTSFLHKTRLIGV